MTKKELLNNKFDRQGYITTSEVEKLGISRQYFVGYLKNVNAVKIANGIYMSELAWPDGMYEIALCYPQTIFSYESSLYLWNLMEREPNRISVTVKRGYNASGLREKGVEVHNVNRDIFELGKTVIENNYGHTVITYDMERTICDIVKSKDKMDIQIFQFAIKKYMNSKEKNIPKLFEYCKVLKCENKIRTYTEVLL